MNIQLAISIIAATSIIGGLAGLYVGFIYGAMLGDINPEGKRW